MPGDPGTRRALELIRELSEPSAGEPAPEARLADLGFDSLAFAELALALEDELGLDLGDAVLDGSGTVADVLDAVARAGPARGELDVPAAVGRYQGVADLLAGRPLRWWLDLEVVGAGLVPERGGVVLAMNHESALDIPIAVVACPRPITFMAKGELFRSRFSSWSLRRLGAFRVDRERFDLPAVRLALAVARQGGVLGMYPEGTRSAGELLPFLQGAAWVAIRTGAALVPMSLLGTDRGSEATQPRRVHVRVVFGRPLRPEVADEPRERRRRASELTGELRRAIGAGLEG